MNSNMSRQQVQTEMQRLQKTIARLQNASTTLALLSQFQRQGVTRAEWTWFVAGNGPR